MFTPDRGGILISERFEERSKELEASLLPNRCVLYIREDFKIEDAKEVIAEAYRSEEKAKTLILGAKTFTIPAQNALLKILEEPPRNIVFVLLAPNKSAFLPTIRSRLSLTHEQQEKHYEPLELNLSSLDIGGLFEFVKKHERVKKHEAKELIERLAHHALHVEKMVLTTAQLDVLEKAFRLLEVNSRVQSILVMVLIHFLKEVKRAR